MTALRADAGNILVSARRDRACFLAVNRFDESKQVLSKIACFFQRQLVFSSSVVYGRKQAGVGSHETRLFRFVAADRNDFEICHYLPLAFPVVRTV
jgi:hypothetical protein